MNVNQQQVRSEEAIAVVIPCYRVTSHILDVIARIGPEVTRIYVVDDQCPEHSGDYVEQHNHDARVSILRNPRNLGVGGAVMSGYRAAIADGMTVIVKIDGDGQMDPALIAQFVGPILADEADYTKGNRFFHLDEIHQMPAMRLFGNTVLSLMTKLSSGYWNLFDPTNGYTAIHADVARHLPMEKISYRYFFETDMLFRLNLQRAVVVDVPMDAHYGDEVSNLKISKILGEFLVKHARNFGKRLFYNYYLRDLMLASIQLPLGVLLAVFGIIYGGWHWYLSSSAHVATAPGTVMLSALPLLMGVQLILAFLAYDITAVPVRPVHKKYRLRPVRKPSAATAHEVRNTYKVPQSHETHDTE